MSKKKTKDEDENKQNVELRKQNKWQQKTKEAVNANQDTKDDNQNFLIVSIVVVPVSSLCFIDVLMLLYPSRLNYTLYHKSNMLNGIILLRETS